MRLTTNEEALLLERYEMFLQKRVRQYCKNVTLPMSGTWEDLMQEARIVFLEHIRSMKDMSEVMNCWHDMTHALCLYKEAQFVVKLPHHAYKERHKQYTSIPLDDIDKDYSSPFSTDDILSKVELDRFLDTLGCDERMIVERRLDGFNNREILPFTSIRSEPQFSRRLGGIKKKVKRYFMPEPAPNEE